jgi:hypothetical protein
VCDALGLVDAVGKHDGPSRELSEEVVEVRVLLPAHALDVRQLQPGGQRQALISGDRGGR